MSLLCSVCHIFTTYTRIFSSILLLVNKKFFHQSSFKLIKTFFISPASIYATLFIKVRGKVRGGGSPRLVFLRIGSFCHIYLYLRRLMLSFLGSSLVC